MSQTSEADPKSTVTNPRNSFIPGDATAQDNLLAEVDKLINTLSNKMAGVSSEIFAKLDDMERRLDSMEASLQKQEGQGEGDGK